MNIERGEEALRRREGGYGPSYPGMPLRTHRRWKDWRRLIFHGQRISRFAPHASAGEIRAFVGPAVWSEYFSFTIERNPWDHTLSRYWWEKQKWDEKGRTGFPGLTEYLRFLEKREPFWLRNWSYYTIDDRIAVDRVLFFETLHDDLEQLRQDLAIAGNISLPGQRAKSGFRPVREHYREVLSARDREIIERTCRQEIETFGYEF